MDTQWGGQLSDDVCWIGMTYETSIDVQCVSFLDSDVSGAYGLDVQNYNIATNTWETINRFTHLVPGQMHNLSLVPFPCDDGYLIPIRIDITTDSYPNETRWELINVLTNEVIDENGPYLAEDVNMFKTASNAVCPSYCYTFVIYDFLAMFYLTGLQMVLM